MRLLLFVLGLATLSACTKRTPEAPSSPVLAASAAERAPRAPAAKTGISLADFIDIWSLRQAGTAARMAQDKLPTPEQQMQDRIARFRAAHPRLRSGAGTPSAAPASRPGDRAGLREGDKAVLGNKTATATAQVAIDPAVQALRQEQMATRIQQFRAAQQVRKAQSGDNKNLPPGIHVGEAGMRQGDKAGPRPGDIASLAGTGH